MIPTRYKFKLDYLTNINQLINTPINRKFLHTDITQIIEGLDTHSHNTGEGRKLTPAGFYIDKDCDILGFSINNTSSVVLSNTTEKNGMLELKVVDTDFYVFDKDGLGIQLTENGRLKAGDGDAISGDYTDAGAIFHFNSSTNSYSLQQSPNTYANMSVKNLVLSNGANSITLTTATGSQAYSLVFASQNPENAGILYISPTTNAIKKADITDGVFKISKTGEYSFGKIALNDFPTNTTNAFKPFALNAGNAITDDPDYIRLPVGGHTQRPITPATGALRINSETNLLECFFTSDWRSATTESIGGYSLTDFYDVDINNPFDFLYMSEDYAELGHVLKVKSTSTIVNEELMRPDWEASESAPNGILNKPTDLTDMSRHTLDELKDVDLSNPMENYILKYDPATLSFKYAEIGEVSAGMWGYFVGDIKDQTDLWDYLSTFIPWCPLDALPEEEARLNKLEDVEELADYWDGAATVYPREGKVLKFDSVLKEFVHVDAPLVQTSPITHLNALYSFNGNESVEILPPSEVTDTVYLTAVPDSPLGLGWTKLVIGGGGSLLKFTPSLLTPVETTPEFDRYEVVIPKSPNDVYEISLHNFYHGVIRLNTTSKEGVDIAPQDFNNIVDTLLLNDPAILSIECYGVNASFFIFIRGI